MFKLKISFPRKIPIIYEMLGREETSPTSFSQEALCFAPPHSISDGEDPGNEVGEALGFKLDVLRE